MQEYNISRQSQGFFYFFSFPVFTQLLLKNHKFVIFLKKNQLFFGFVALFCCNK